MTLNEMTEILYVIDILQNEVVDELGWYANGVTSQPYNFSIFLPIAIVPDH
jgi:hypothetical protein